MESKERLESKEQPPYLKPIEIKRMARVPYSTVILWIEVGHERAGKLPAVDFS